MDKPFEEMTYVERKAWITQTFWQGLADVGSAGVARAAITIWNVIAQEAYQRGFADGQKKCEGGETS